MSNTIPAGTLKPITLDGVTIEVPVYVAPMSGVSDLPFRRLSRRLGAGMVVSEMIASQAMVRENRQTLKMAEVDGFGAPSAVQLAGCDPQVMAEAATGAPVVLDLSGLTYLDSAGLHLLYRLSHARSGGAAPGPAAAGDRR